MFTEKYDYVGRLLKPGEKPTNYSDEEDESSVSPQTTATSSPQPQEEQPQQDKPKSE
jgi:membrane-associated progesterone receptor component